MKKLYFLLVLVGVFIVHAKACECCDLDKNAHKLITMRNAAEANALDARFEGLREATEKWEVVTSRLTTELHKVLKASEGCKKKLHAQAHQ